MKKAAILFFGGAALGVAVFLLRRNAVPTLTAACDALTLSGGAIFFFSAFARLAGSECADGIRYAAVCGLKGLFPFARAQSFRAFKEERAKKRTGREEGKEGKEGLLFGGTLFFVGLFLTIL